MLSVLAAAVLIPLAAIVATLPGLKSALADEFPTRPVRLILPQPAGGAVDLIARSLGEVLSERLKQPVVVENMPGANGGLAAAAVLRAPPDGHTLFFAVDSNLVVNPSLYPTIAYDPFRDFVPISIAAQLHVVLVANPNVPFNSVQELIAHARAHPNKLNYAGIGFGSAMHMGMEMFKYVTKTEINHVPFRGTAPAITAVIGGVVDIMLTGPQAAKGMGEAGKLKLLAVAAPKRMGILPEVPTMHEAGVPGYEMGGWFGLLAPAKTPRPVLARLTQEVRAAAADARFGARMTKQGLEVVGSSPEQMLSTMQAERTKWSDLIKAQGIKIPE